MKIRTIGLIGSILIGSGSLLAVEFGIAQSKPASAAKPKKTPKDEAEGVYFETWDQGDSKSCTTYSRELHLLICDEAKLEWDESFLSLVASNFKAGWTRDESYRRAFAFCRSRAEQLTVSFSQAAWPAPRSGSTLTNWSCKRTDIVTCKFAGRYSDPR